MMLTKRPSKQLFCTLGLYKESCIFSGRTLKTTFCDTPVGVCASRLTIISNPASVITRILAASTSAISPDNKLVSPIKLATNGEAGCS